jgi:hypothetical protein
MPQAGGRGALTVLTVSLRANMCERQPDGIGIERAFLGLKAVRALTCSMRELVTAISA